MPIARTYARVVRLFPLLVVCCALGRCAITFHVQKVDREIDRRILDVSRQVRLADRRFGITETVVGDDLFLQLTGDATRQETSRTEYEVRYRSRKTIRYQDGDYRLRFHALFWGGEFATESWRDYALGNLALLFPTLALSGVVMLVDLATLPLRLVDFDREVRTKTDHAENTRERRAWRPERVVARCGSRTVSFTRGRARLPIASLLAGPGRWRGTVVCRVSAPGETELLRHAIHLDRIALRSRAVREHIAARQLLILAELAAAVREARAHFAAGSPGGRPSLPEIQREVRLREAIVDLTRYVAPLGPARIRIREIGQDLLYLSPREVVPRLDALTQLLRAPGVGPVNPPR